MRPSPLRFAALVPLVVFAALSLTADGSASAAEIRVPDDQPTIQSAIDAAAPGDVILVAADVYLESIDFRGKEITVRGEGEFAFDTVIDGSGAPKPVCQMIRGEGTGAVLENLTLRGGTGRLKGGTRYGGGLVCREASPTLRNVWIEESSADIGGGMAIFRGEPRFEDLVLRFNEGGTGAGAAFIQTTATIDGCSVIRCTTPDVTPAIPVAHGLGIDCLDSTLDVTDCRITECRVTSLDADHVEGVAIAVRGDGSELNLDGGIVELNLVGAPTTGDGTAIFVGPGARADVHGVLFYENTSPGNGGAVFVDSAGAAELSACRFVRNLAALDGGAIAAEGSELRVLNSLFLLNRALGAGGAIASEAADALHCTFVKNSSDLGLGGATSGDLSITSSILWGNIQPPGFPQQVSGAPTIRYSDVEGGWPGEGNIDEDPEFARWESDDFRFMNDEYLLRIDSPCVDAGDPGPVLPPTDLYGAARAVDGDTDGNADPDMGAHEMHREVASRYGDVDRNAGFVRVTYDQLFVNGEIGDVERELTLDFDDGIRIDIESPLNPKTATFIVQLHLGTPSVSTVAKLPARIGYSPMPFLFEDGASPSAVWNNIGVPGRVGATNYFGDPLPDPGEAPRTLLDLPAGDAVNLPPGTVFTLQGVIENFESESSRRVSATNALVVTIE